MSLTRRTFVTSAAAAAAGLVLPGAPAASALPARRSAVTGPWREGEVRGPWRLEYHGYGTVTSGEDWVREAPMASSDPDETHASLVLSTRTFTTIDLTAYMRTDRQLRTGTAPNPWETAWLLWHYTDDLHFYALALKPNGWELSKEDPAYPGAQRYLRTGSSPRFPIGSVAKVRVRQQGASIRVDVNDRFLTSFTDRERPYGAGRVGLYNEDAAVTFGRVRMFGAPLPTR